MDLHTSLIEFVKTFKRSDKNFGVIDIAHPPTTFTEPFPLGSTLREYYSTLRFEGRPMIGATFMMSLAPVDGLETYQAGWRWVTNKAGEVEEETQYWKPHWVIIAERNGDALVVDINDGKVYGSIPGAKEDRLFFISDNLSLFFQALTEGMKLEMDKYKFEVADEDFNHYPSFLNDIKAMATSLLGIEGAKGFFHYFFG